MDAQEAINTIWKNACFKCKHADFRCTAYKNCEYSGERNYIESKTYCGGNYSGIIGRFKRAWKAFFGKPVCYSGVYIENSDRVKDFLQKCMVLVNNGEYANK